MQNGDASTAAGAIVTTPTNDKNYLPGREIYNDNYPLCTTPLRSGGRYYVNALHGDCMVDKRRGHSSSEIMKSFPISSSSPFSFHVEAHVSIPTTFSLPNESEGKNIIRTRTAEQQQQEVMKQINSTTEETVNEAAINTPLPFSDLESNGEDEKGGWFERLLNFNNNPDRKMSIDIPSPSFGFQQDQRTSFSRTAVVRQQCSANEINQGNNKATTRNNSS